MNQFKMMSHNQFRAISGAEIVRMMRGARVTIRQMAETNGIAMTRVREIRVSGAAAGITAWEIFFMIREAQIANAR